jgi:hypothetical protein
MPRPRPHGWVYVVSQDEHTYCVRNLENVDSTLRFFVGLVENVPDIFLTYLHPCRQSPTYTNDSLTTLCEEEPCFIYGYKTEEISCTARQGERSLVTLNERFPNNAVRGRNQSI